MVFETESCPSQRVAPTLYIPDSLGLQCLHHLPCLSAPSAQCALAEFPEYVLFEGHDEVVRVFLENEASADGRTPSNAQSAAFYNGQKERVRLLLEKWTNCDEKLYGNVLTVASNKSHLLSKRVDVNTEVGTYENKMLAASCTGHEEVVQFLLDWTQGPLR